jgi:hypothetical protein
MEEVFYTTNQAAMRLFGQPNMTTLFLGLQQSLHRYCYSPCGKDSGYAHRYRSGPWGI